MRTFRHDAEPRINSIISSWRYRVDYEASTKFLLYSILEYEIVISICESKIA